MQHKTRLIAVVILFTALLLAGCGFRPADAAGNGEPTPVAQSLEEENASLRQQVADLTAQITALTERIDQLLAGQSGSPAGTEDVTTAGGSDNNGSSWTSENKCSWLRENFPQSTKAVQAFGASLANVPTARIRTHEFRCSREANAMSVFDGFIVLGPNEGFAGAVTLQVPVGGAIDAYAESCGASYSQPPTLINDFAEVCDDTWRATAGSVTALSMTYWPWNDDNSPLGGTSSSASMSEEPVAEATVSTDQAECLHPSDLVKKVNAADASGKVWKDQGMVDTTYGGLRIEVLKDSELPAGWEGVGPGNAHISADDSGRTIAKGEFWSIYPPRGECRAELGFSD
jgi:hypothetical protein